jgi:hypothetical protein
MWQIECGNDTFLNQMICLVSGLGKKCRRIAAVQLSHLDSICFSFFPNVLQPPIALVGNTVHEFLVRIGICRRTVRKFDMAAAPTGITISLPGIDPHDMERRRLEYYCL